jgi:hypothetical protein
MWIGESPNEETPPGATYLFNTLAPLRGLTVVGLAIHADEDNPGEYLASIMLGSYKTGEAYVFRLWKDENKTAPGYAEVEQLVPPIDKSEISGNIVA